MSRTTYLGGIPEMRKTGPSGLVPHSTYLAALCTGFNLKTIKIPYDDIIDVTLVPDGRKKKNYLLNIEYMSNGLKTCAVYSGEGISSEYASIQKHRQKYAQTVKPTEDTTKDEITFGDDTSVNTQIDVTEELGKYFTLKEKGIITEDEFEAKKSQLLNL